MVLPLLFGIISVFLFGFGLHRILLKDDDWPEAVIFSVAVGTGTLSLAIMVLNRFLDIAINYNNMMILNTAFLALGIVFFFICRSKEISFLPSKAKTRGAEDGKGRKKAGIMGHKLVVCIICVLLLLMVYKAILFPGVNGDGSYYYQASKEIFDTGSITSDAGPGMAELVKAYPQFFYIIGAWLCILSMSFEETLIQAIPLVFAMLLCLATYSLARKIFKDKFKASLAVLLLLSLPMFVNHGVYLNSDTTFSFFAVCGVLFIVRYLMTERTAYLLAGTAMLGFMINVKYLGLPFAASVLVPLIIVLFGPDVALLVKGRRRLTGIINDKRIKTRLRWLIVCLIMLLMIILPLFIRNYIDFNDPYYPYLTAYLPEHFKGKNFSPLLYKPVANAFKQINILATPANALFGVINFMRSKDYSMSLFIVILLALTLTSFKNLRKEQRYLLYFSIIFTIAYIISSLQMYRYLMPVAAILCVVLADRFHNILYENLDAREKRIILSSLIVFAAGLGCYFLALANNEFIISMLGSRAARFMAGVDVFIVMHLLVAVAAGLIIMLVRSKKARSVITIMIIMIPSAFSLAIINYGAFDIVLGQFDKSKDLSLLKQELRLIPDKEAVLKMNFGDSYEAAMFIRDNLPEDAVILSYGGHIYYAERANIPIDSYKLVETYDQASPDALADALGLMKSLGISHVLYKKPGWDEEVFGAGELISRSEITSNLHDDRIFHNIYENKLYIVYAIEYPEGGRAAG